ncbi:MAG: hypothetical protein ACI83Y_001702, partial [Candidatus Azotimanducaceae bacterium]
MESRDLESRDLESRDLESRDLESRCDLIDVRCGRLQAVERATVVAEP